MRILFITTHPPFPPIDGVRIPAAHHLNALSEKHVVDCLILQCETITYSRSDIRATQEEVNRLYEVEMSGAGKLGAICREVFLSEPYYGRWRFGEALPEELVKTEYDLVWCGTAPAVAIMAKKEIRKELQGKWYAAGLSDIHSLVIRLNAKEAAKSSSFLYRYVKMPLLRVRSQILRKAERKMLSCYELCTMQTEGEGEWVRAMGADFDKRILVLPNGVNSRLFELSLERTEKHLFFVGMVSGIYGERIQWFFKHAWPLIEGRVTGIKATVIGKGATPELKRFFEEQGVGYTSFVEVLEDIYQGRMVMIAPIFKGYGIINKVLESMASGCLVVGDKTAFNGIAGFEDGVHGLVAETAEEFADKVCRCFESEDYLIKIRTEGRRLVKKQFGWRKRYAVLQARVSEIIK